MSAPDIDPIETVLVPTDGSELSHFGLVVGRRLGRRLDARVRVLMAVAKPEEVGVGEEAVRALAPGLQPDDISVVVDLDPAEAIHHELRRLDRAVACIPTHGRGRTAALVGSVATDVIARCLDPAVLVGPDFRETTPVGQRVVICVEDDTASVDVVRVGIRWAKLLDEEPLVVTVAEEVPEPLRGGPPKRAFGPDGDVELFLEQLVAPLRTEDEVVETLAVFDPVGPGSGLASFLRRNPAPLVVTGSRARPGLLRLQLGRTGMSIIGNNPSPVLVIPLV